MKTWIIVSTPDKAVTLRATEIKADTYTMAYLGASIKLPEAEEILRVYEVVR